MPNESAGDIVYAVETLEQRVANIEESTSKALDEIKTSLRTIEEYLSQVVEALQSGD